MCVLGVEASPPEVGKEAFDPPALAMILPQGVGVVDAGNDDHQLIAAASCPNVQQARIDTLQVSLQAHDPAVAFFSAAVLVRSRPHPISDDETETFRLPTRAAGGWRFLSLS